MPACFQCSAQCTVSEPPQLRLSCSGKLGSACFVHQVNPESTIFHLFCIQVLYFSESKIFLVFCICVLYQIPASKDKQKIAGGKLKGRIGPKLFLCFLRLESKDKSKTGGGKLQRKQGLEKQLRHHSAAVQTGGKWKYTKTDR